MFLLISLLFFIPQAWAAENTQGVEVPAVISGDFKGMKHTSSARVDKIIDQQTVLMKDGKVIRLLGLEYPSNEDVYFQGKSRLEKILAEGTEVMLYQTRQQAVGRENRMGHILAHLVNKESGEWINGVMIAEGMAWVMTDASNPEMADQLYALEQKARDAKAGLWAEKSPYGLLTPETALQGDGSFRVVEGAINRAATSKNNLYLNFGNDWRSDFTVMVSPDMRKTLSHRGVDLMGLAGKKIRIRGEIRQWNGPFMELETPERLEILSTLPSTELPPDSSTKKDVRDSREGILHSNP